MQRVEMSPGEGGLPAISADAFRTRVRGMVREGWDAEQERLSPTRLAELRSLSPTGVPDVAVAWIVGLYLELLKRLPDASGLATHLHNYGKDPNPERVAAELAGSAEAQRWRRLGPVDLSTAFARGSTALMIGLEPESDVVARTTDNHRAHGDSELTLWWLCRQPEYVGPRGAVTPLAVRRAEALQRRLLRVGPTDARTSLLAPALASPRGFEGCSQRISVHWVGRLTHAGIRLIPDRKWRQLEVEAEMAYLLDRVGAAEVDRLLGEAR